MDADVPNKKRLQLHFGDMVRKMAISSVTTTNRVVLFGEMVAVLWTQKKYHAAIQLQQPWNEPTRMHPFYLCCAYPAEEFGENSDAYRAAICAEHTCEVSAFEPRLNGLQKCAYSRRIRPN